MTREKEALKEGLEHDEQLQSLVGKVKAEDGTWGKAKDLVQDIEALHPSDFARLLQYLDAQDREALLGHIHYRCDPEFLLFLDDTVRQDLIETIPSKPLGHLLNQLDDDDCISILEDLEEESLPRVFSHMEHSKQKQLKKRLLYPEDSAGRLMQEDVLALPGDWTIKKTLEYLASDYKLPENFYELYVLGSEKKPVGVISLSQLIKQPKKLVLKDIMEEEFQRIPAYMDQNEVAHLFRKYDFISAPVVNHKGKLVGMVTIDDVIDVIDEKAEEDLLHMGQIATSDFYAPVLPTSLGRIRWLIVTLVNSILASLVIDQFDHNIRQTIGAAPLMTMAVAMAGNSGMQSVTVSLRALIARELSFFNIRKAIQKEAMVAVINGLCFACILGSMAFFWYHNAQLSAVLFCAVVFNMLWAAVVGTCLPVVIDHFKRDPTLSAGPLLTTSTDVVGFAIFLSLLRLFVP